MERDLSEVLRQVDAHKAEEKKRERKRGREEEEGRGQDG